MTKDELITLLANQKSKKTSATWGQFIAALNTTSDVQKEIIINAINNKDMPALIAALTALVETNVFDTVKQDITTKFAGVNVKVTDLLDIYG